MLGYAHGDNYLGSVREIWNVDESSSSIVVEGNNSWTTSQAYTNSCGMAYRGEVARSLSQDRSSSWTENKQKERLIYSRNSPIIERNKGAKYG